MPSLEEPTALLLAVLLAAAAAAVGSNVDVEDPSCYSEIQEPGWR